MRLAEKHDERLSLAVLFPSFLEEKGAPSEASKHQAHTLHAEESEA